LRDTFDPICAGLLDYLIGLLENVRRSGFRQQEGGAPPQPEAVRPCGIRQPAGPTGQQECPERIRLQRHVYRCVYAGAVSVCECVCGTVNQPKFYLHVKTEAAKEVALSFANSHY